MFSMDMMNESGLCYSSAMPSFIAEWDQSSYDVLVNTGCNCSQIALDNNMINLQCDTPIIHAWWTQTIYILMFSVIIFMGCFGNSIVIWIVLAHRRMRTVTNYFLLNLAISDLSISIFNVCFSFTYNLYFNWFFGDVYCHINSFMGVVPTCSSVLTLMSMSLDRYMAIVHPLRPRLSRRKTLGCIVSIWILAVCSGIPSLIYSQTSHFFFEHNHVVTCTVNFPSVILSEIHNHFLLALMYLLPLVVLSFTYTLVARALWGSQPIGDHKQEDSIRAKRRVVKMMIVVVTLFLVCWLPYHLYFTVLIYKLADYFSNIVILHIYLNMYWLAMSSTVVNPVIYCYMNKRFRTGFLYVFRWLPFLATTAEDYRQSELCEDPRRYSQSTYLARTGRLNRNPAYSGPKSSKMSKLRLPRDFEYDSISGTNAAYSEPPSAKHSLAFNGTLHNINTQSVRANVLENVQNAQGTKMKKDVLDESKDFLQKKPTDFAEKDYIITSGDHEELYDKRNTDFNENSVDSIENENNKLLHYRPKQSPDGYDGTDLRRELPVSISMHVLPSAQTTPPIFAPKRSQTSDEFLMILKM